MVYAVISGLNLCAKKVIIEESIPPLKNVPTGTSAFNLICTLFSSKDFMLLIFVITSSLFNVSVGKL
ncbi:MAG: hypothetical protein BWX61_01212 [Bacteroidetes bacterium ADurb.Bin035]|nr:MAG: hypothetical protein BWX61_01212 [Bacteroidetes bacterium ADurb.Bin035]